MHAMEHAGLCGADWHGQFLCPYWGRPPSPEAEALVGVKKGAHEKEHTADYRNESPPFFLCIVNNVEKQLLPWSKTIFRITARKSAF